MESYCLRGVRLNHLLKMVDREKLIQYLLNHHPDWDKDIVHHYTENVKHIRESFKAVLSRDLNSEENGRLRQHSMDLALIQVADKYRDEINNVETKEKDGTT